MRELSLNNCRLDKRYDVRRQLGRGSYAEIYLAKDILASPQSPHSVVVIKALNVFLQDDLDADLERTLVENFQNEAIALDRVRHPNIISRLGHGTARDLQGTVFHYLVLEYLPGGDLQRATKHGRLSFAQVLNYIEQVCAGLKHAHDRGVIHRDIKPQNLLLTEDRSTVKIADFGVARFSHSDAPITRVGTNVYAPPEHSPLHTQSAAVDNGKLTPAADIYSLAKSVFFLLTGESPRSFSNSPITELPVDCRSEEWAGELIRILQKATIDEPEARYQDAAGFWMDLATLRKFVKEPGPAIAETVAAPMPHVSRGYSPIAPVQPRFNTSRDLRLRFPAIANDARREPAIDHTAEYRGRYQTGELIRSDLVPVTLPGIEQAGIVISPDVTQPRKKRRIFRKLAAFTVFVGLFAGILYGTHAYLRGAGFLPDISGPSRTQATATANTDIYLRPAPNTNNDPIGLVTKNSRVRIVNSQNNWYQVDVVEQGRIRANQASANRGWLNGKYLDLD